MNALLDNLWYRVTERLGDYGLGISTHGIVPVDGFAPGRPDLRDSMPIGYRALFTVLRELPIRPEECGFLDYGCGKGRACAVAAALGFRSVTGVELSDDLAETTRRNLDRMRWRRTRRVEIITGDARTYVVPDDVQVIYLFNPFVGEVLQGVSDQIRDSLVRAPRELHIVFFNNGSFDTILEGSSWMRKRTQRLFYPRLNCGLYTSA